MRWDLGFVIWDLELEFEIWDFRQRRLRWRKISYTAPWLSETT